MQSSIPRITKITQYIQVDFLVPKPRFVNLGVSNVNGCRFLSTSRISTASKGMPFCITRGHPVKSFHAQYVRRSFPDQTK